MDGEEGGAVTSVEQAATDPATRVYNVAKVVLPAANHDGVAGDECVALLDPEHRLRTIILVEPVGPGGTCALGAYSAGAALSFTWGDTAAYSSDAGRLALRAGVGDPDGAVHRLVGALTSEAPAMAALQSFLALPDGPKDSQLQTFAATRVHSIYDFEGADEVAAEAAYQSVRVTQACENPGSPRLEARTFAGFVYGYTASNSGSCHSGWFSMLHVYDRNWRRVGTHDYGE